MELDELVQKLTETDERLRSTESKLEETEYLLARALERAAGLNKKYREIERQAMQLAQQNQAMQGHVDQLQAQLTEFETSDGSKGDVVAGEAVKASDN